MSHGLQQTTCAHVQKVRLRIVSDVVAGPGRRDIFLLLGKEVLQSDLMSARELVNVRVIEPPSSRIFTNKAESLVALHTPYCTCGQQNVMPWRADEPWGFSMGGMLCEAGLAGS